MTKLNIENSETFECPVCLDEYTIGGNEIKCDTCLKFTCIHCASNITLTGDSSFICPLCRADGTGIITALSFSNISDDVAEWFKNQPCSFSIFVVFFMESEAIVARVIDSESITFDSAINNEQPGTCVVCAQFPTPCEKEHLYPLSGRMPWYGWHDTLPDVIDQLHSEYMTLRLLACHMFRRLGK